MTEFQNTWAKRIQNLLSMQKMQTGSFFNSVYSCSMRLLAPFRLHDSNRFSQVEICLWGSGEYRWLDCGITFLYATSEHRMLDVPWIRHHKNDLRHSFWWSAVAWKSHCHMWSTVRKLANDKRLKIVSAIICHGTIDCQPITATRDKK